MAEYSCPKCSSHKVFARWPDFTCGACGHAEKMVDFPCSPTFMEYYAIQNGVTITRSQPEVRREYPILESEPDLTKEVPNVNDLEKINLRINKLRANIIDVQKQAAKKKPQAWE